MNNKLNLEEGTVLISRVDSIGDVLLTLPLCAALKRDNPNMKIVFLASAYTIPVVKHCTSVDEIIDATELFNSPTVVQKEKIRAIGADAIVHVFPKREIAQLAKAAKIPLRIGTSHRSFHLLTCNQRINFTRKNSKFHEAQLNFHLLRSFGYEELPSWEELNENLDYFKPSVKINHPGLETEKPKVILHAKSQGSAVEWPIEKYAELTQKLVEKGCRVFFTGTEKEGAIFRDQINWSRDVIDTTGQFSLDELISFIDQSDVLVACSTGPLHIAGMLNSFCIGLFTPKRPMHPGRWRPLGKQSRTITTKEKCTCKSKAKCTCLAEIEVDQVFNQIQEKLRL